MPSTTSAVLKTKLQRASTMFEAEKDLDKFDKQVAKEVRWHFGLGELTDEPRNFEGRDMRASPVAGTEHEKTLIQIYASRDAVLEYIARDEFKLTLPQYKELEAKIRSWAVEVLDPADADVPALEVDAEHGGGKARVDDGEPDREPTKNKDEVYTKLVPPKKTYSGTEDFELWERAITVWASKYVGQVSDGRLGAELMEVITGKAEETVFHHIEKGAETFSRIMQTLKTKHGRKGMPKATDATMKLAVCKRDKRTMSSSTTTQPRGARRSSAGK